MKKLLNIFKNYKTHLDKWAKPILVLSILGILFLVLPNKPIDDWNILNLKKMTTVIFALVILQIMGSILHLYLGANKGAILTGFLGGLISSTATTASLAHKSKDTSLKNIIREQLIYFAATMGMLFEVLAILFFGTEVFHISLLLIPAGPIVITAFMIYRLSKKPSENYKSPNGVEFSLLPILRLSGFIILILALSKLLQNIFGQSGLLVLTFLVSLFEIHGSVIANLGMYDSGAFDLKWLGILMAISIASSYVSKIFLIHSIGSNELLKQVLKRTVVILLSLLISSSLFILVTTI